MRKTMLTMVLIVMAMMICQCQPAVLARDMFRERDGLVVMMMTIMMVIVVVTVMVIRSTSFLCTK